jgi:hypothetical protein
LDRGSVDAARAALRVAATFAPVQRIQVQRIYDAFGPRRSMWRTGCPLIERYTICEKILALCRNELDFLAGDDKT